METRIFFLFTIDVLRFHAYIIDSTPAGPLLSMLTSVGFFVLGAVRDGLWLTMKNFRNHSNY